jgi:hypothetical protein
MWLALVVAFVGMAALPVSNRLTRLGSIVTLLAGWGLLTVICWRRLWSRASLLALSILCLAFLMLPPRTHTDIEPLRHGFVVGLQRYDGVRYFWGGEGFTGIDCSGLVRRGLIDSLFLRGLRTFDGGLVRHALSLWWHDCSASDLGEEYNHLTVRVFDTPSINSMDHARLLPGDLAVTKGGEQVMAYLGDHLWIEADPLAHRVITVCAPSQKNAWFHGPMKIVRWSILNQQ